jgi:hypothetical protein
MSRMEENKPEDTLLVSSFNFNLNKKNASFSQTRSRNDEADDEGSAFDHKTQNKNRGSDAQHPKRPRKDF